MKNFRNILMSTVSAFFLTSCAQMQADWLKEQRSSFVQIKKGMSEEDVTSLIAYPDDKYTNPNSAETFWKYHTGTVRFDPSKKVSSIVSDSFGKYNFDITAYSLEIPKGKKYVIVPNSTTEEFDQILFDENSKIFKTMLAKFDGEYVEVASKQEADIYFYLELNTLAPEQEVVTKSKAQYDLVYNPATTAVTNVYGSYGQNLGQVQTTVNPYGSLGTQYAGQTSWSETIYSYKHKYIVSAVKADPVMNPLASIKTASAKSRAPSSEDVKKLKQYWRVEINYKGDRQNIKALLPYFNFHALGNSNLSTTRSTSGYFLDTLIFDLLER